MGSVGVRGTVAPVMIRTIQAARRLPCSVHPHVEGVIHSGAGFTQRGATNEGHPTQMSDRPTPPDPADVAEAVRMFAAVEATNPQDFAEQLADNIMDPDPVETAAFRHPDLAFKSEIATRYLLENARSVLARRRRGSQEQRRTEMFLSRVNMERRFLKLVTDGQRAQRGQLPAQPNPRQRALRKLASENLAGDVPKGRFRVLLEQEKQADIDRKVAEKAERAAARKAAKLAKGS